MKYKLLNIATWIGIVNFGLWIGGKLFFLVKYGWHTTPVSSMENTFNFIIWHVFIASIWLGGLAIVLHTTAQIENEKKEIDRLKKEIEKKRKELNKWA